MSIPEARFVAGNPKVHIYDSAYTGTPNWDIGRPQRAFVQVEAAGWIRSPVLDVGCGTGELSLYLARRGHEVLGIDLSPQAIRHARGKARWRRIDAQFLVWDALRIHEFTTGGLRFQTVVDSAMYHIFGPTERDWFVDELSAVLPPGGRYLVLGDAKQDSRSLYGLSPTELRDRFRTEDGWEIEFSVRTTFERRYSRNLAYLVGIRRSQ